MELKFMDKYRLIGVALLLMIIPVVVLSLRYNLVTNITDLATQVTAGVILILIASGVSLSFKGSSPPPPTPPPSQPTTPTHQRARMDEVATLLRRFNMRWDQYARLTQYERWHSPVLEDVKTQARELSGVLLNYFADEGDTFAPHWRTEIRELADLLQRFGNWTLHYIGDAELLEMDRIGSVAYNLSTGLVEDMSS